MGNCKVGGVHDQSLTKLETPSFGDEMDDHFIEGFCTSLLIPALRQFSGFLQLRTSVNDIFACIS